jgi:AcrR family transcriptional regulator
MYEYFKSKNDLFQKMMIEISRTYFDTLDSKVSETVSVKEKLQLILGTHLKFLKEHRAMANMLMVEHHLFGEELRQWICKNQMEKLNKLQKLIEDGIDRKEFRSIDSKLQASIISAVVVSAGSYYVTEQKADVNDIIDKTMKIILYGLLLSS